MPNMALPKIFLVFHPGPNHKKRVVELVPDRPPLLCGRRHDPAAPPDIALYGETTSRKHANVRMTGGVVSIQDLGTSNGTYESGKKLRAQAWHTWQPNQVIMFGLDPENPNGKPSSKCDHATLKVVNSPSPVGPLTCTSSTDLPPAAGTPLPRARPVRRATDPEAMEGNTNGVASNGVAANGCCNGHRQDATAVPIGPQLPPGFVNGRTNGDHIKEEKMVGPLLPLAQADESEAPSRGVKRAREVAPEGVCDKCDERHPTEKCPHFKKGRENHKDAWLNYGRKHPLSGMGRTGAKYVLKQARVVPQPGDGSCLFHSLCHGLKGEAGSAERLRRELMVWISRNPTMQIAGDTLEEWIKWDTESSVAAYTRRMSVGGWGGGIEMAACSIIHRTNVHVYETRRHGEFERISCFDAPEQTNRTIHVLYKGGMHFDAIMVR